MNIFSSFKNKLNSVTDFNKVALGASKFYDKLFKLNGSSFNIETLQEETNVTKESERIVFTF